MKTSEETTSTEKRSWVFEDFDFYDALGNGKFGYVYKAKEKKSGKIVAVKLINQNILTQYNFFSQLKNEIEIHSRLIFEYIVRMYGYFYDKKYVYVVYEYCPNGNLFDYIKKNSHFSEEKTAEIIFKVAKALLFIRKKNIIHRDLKLENILLDENLNCKVSDFGWACQNINNKRQTICGTIDYLSPEVSENLLYDFSVDVWSLGVMIYELVTGTSPFSGKNDNETFENIKNINIDLRNDEKLKGVKVSDEMIQLLEKIFVKNDRITIEKILESDWFKKFGLKSNVQ